MTVTHACRPHLVQGHQERDGQQPGHHKPGARRWKGVRPGARRGEHLPQRNSAVRHKRWTEGELLFGCWLFRTFWLVFTWACALPLPFGFASSGGAYVQVTYAWDTLGCRPGACSREVARPPGAGARYSCGRLLLAGPVVHHTVLECSRTFYRTPKSSNHVRRCD